MKYKVHVRRTEEYTESIIVKARTPMQAKAKVQKVLDSLGWAGIFGVDDGDLEECASEVTIVEPCKPD